MITDEERREVAQKLRGLPIDMYSTIEECEKDGLFIVPWVQDMSYCPICGAEFTKRGE